MTVTTQSQNLYLTVEQVARRLNVSTDSIYRWKRNGDFPTAVKIGPGCTRWRLSDIEAHENTFEACFSFDAGMALWD
ncbi:helix-turn-helix transcriptional regulator [Paracoccus aestuariivivens]|uniref:Helix-turn-helix domain-containing protein n=1 Tax=Paracoccus aestuariivivens TaxID=1820333 RepID=A0A6L6J7J8_9RHOB|nr:helix-turn-helix domain-containing protein [Paracoccus aestuariivivens]MTH77165.1 helix-turn-helix domain-containing protein [Paracoccus aestuariivivens]